MTATRSSRKRPHNDLEDSDECLPISKRINSLHIEVQSNSTNLQDVPGTHISPSFAVFCDDMAASSTPLTGNPGLQSQPDLIQSAAARRLNMATEASASPRLPTIDEISNCVQYETNNHGSIPTGPNLHPHFSRSMSDPHGAYLPYPSQFDSYQSQQQAMYTSSQSSQHQTQMMHQGASNHNFQPLQFTSPPMSCDPLVSPQSSSMVNGFHTSGSQCHNQQLSPFQEHSVMRTSSFERTHSNHFPGLQFARSETISSSQDLGTEQQQCASFHTNSSDIPHDQDISDDNQEFQIQQLPSGAYEPELGVSENPYYFNVNQMLYEAHLARVRRENSS